MKNFVKICKEMYVVDHIKRKYSIYVSKTLTQTNGYVTLFLFLQDIPERKAPSNLSQTDLGQFS
jgi:hypothetical protein